MKLDSLIEEAYNVFSHYTISSRLDVCKVCCITDEEEKILTRAPLRGLNEDQLSNYICSARCYSNKEQLEMCYFLPRILEMVSQNIYPTISSETLFDRLFDDNNTFIGTESEHCFLNTFFLHYWINYINHYPQQEPVQDILVMMGRHFNIDPLLKQWTKSKSTASVLHFVDLMINKDYKQISSYPNVQMESRIDIWLKKADTKMHFMAEIENVYMNDGYLGLNSYKNDYWLKVDIEVAYTTYMNIDTGFHT